jgi:hypothetical protein
MTSADAAVDSHQGSIPDRSDASTIQGSFSIGSFGSFFIWRHQAALIDRARSALQENSPENMGRPR